MFYREAGPTDAPIVLLLGYPSFSQMFRDLFPELAKNYCVIASDLPVLRPDSRAAAGQPSRADVGDRHVGSLLPFS